MNLEEKSKDYKEIVELVEKYRNLPRYASDNKYWYNLEKKMKFYKEKYKEEFKISNPPKVL